jgi:hypothetical protein
MAPSAGEGSTAFADVAIDLVEVEPHTSADAQ